MQKDQCRLEFARESHRIEERIGIAVAHEFCFDAGELALVTRELQCQGEMLLERGRDQFRQPDRVQEARSDASGEARAHNGEDRSARPKRVARGRVRAIGQRIEKKIGQAMLRQILGVTYARRKDKSRGRDAPRLSLPLEIAGPVQIILEKPEHALPDLGQEPHPEIEMVWRDLPAVIETAKNEAIWGQPSLCASWCLREDALR